MNKTQLLNKLYSKYQFEPFKRKDITAAISEIKEYVVSNGYYASSLRPDGSLMNPTKQDSRYLVKENNYYHIAPESYINEQLAKPARKTTIIISLQNLISTNS